MIVPTVTNLQVELTSNCNAMCPGCGRNIDGVSVNPNLVVGPNGNMSQKLWKKIVYNDWINLNYISPVISFHIHCQSSPWNPQCSLLSHLMNFAVLWV